MQKGSTKTHLKSSAFAIFSKCITVWISRNQNTKADYISNIIDYDDWQTTHGFFRFIESIWGTHTIGRLVNVLNTKLRRFGFQKVNVWMLFLRIGRKKTISLFLLFI